MKRLCTTAAALGLLFSGAAYAQTSDSSSGSGGTAPTTAASPAGTRITLQELKAQTPEQRTETIKGLSEEERAQLKQECLGVEGTAETELKDVCSDPN